MRLVVGMRLTILLGGPTSLSHGGSSMNTGAAERAAGNESYGCDVGRLVDLPVGCGVLGPD